MTDEACCYMALRWCSRALPHPLLLAHYQLRRRHQCAQRLQDHCMQHSQVCKVRGHDAKVLVLVGVSTILLSVAAASSRCEGARRRRVPLLLLPAAVAVWPAGRTTPSAPAGLLMCIQRAGAQCGASCASDCAALALRRTAWHLCLSSRRGLSCLLGLSYRRELRPASR